ncbi:hypothetical protein LBMAG42_10270 [Deltaproteobacteria bacterium]|nr:hypothetical protein LBMAG42_10270 [Deltaproteobacteria bacterium]
MDDSNARRLALPACLFWFFAGLYVMLSGAHVYSPDGVVMVRLTEALVDDRSLSFRALAGWPEHGGPRAPVGRDGETRRFSKYGLLPSLAGVPAYLVSGVLADVAPASERTLFTTPATREGRENARDPSPTFDGDRRAFRTLLYSTSESGFREALGMWCVQLTSAGVTAGLAVLAYLLGLELGFRRRAALAVAATLGLATPFFCYAREFWSEPFAAMALLGALLLLVRAQAGKGPGTGLVGAGALLGSIILIKPALFVLAAPVAVLHLASRGAVGRRFVQTGLAAAGATGPILLALAYNYLRFGSVFETGYGAEAAEWTTPALTGAIGLLVSPGRGVLVYAPIVLLGYSTLPALWRRSRLVAGVAASSLPLLIGLYCRWWMWEGGWCWGPRFLLPAIPCLLYGVGELAEGRLSRVHRAFGAMTLGFSALAAWSTLLVHDFDFHTWIWRFWRDHEAALQAQGLVEAYDLVRWDWHYAPIVRYWSFPIRETLIWPLALRQPGVVLAVHGAALLAMLGGALGLRRALGADRATPASPTSVPPGR